MNRFAFILIGILVYSCSLYSQKLDFIPQKYFKPQKISWRPYSNRDSLLEENQYYTFTVKKIIPLREGYMLKTKTIVNNQKVSAVIITPFDDFNSISPGVCPLRVNKKYPISVQRYFLVPANHIGIEAVTVADILLGNKTISVNEGGFHWYLFSSMDLCGLSMWDKTEVEYFRYLYHQDSALIQETLDSFIKYVCFQKTPFNLIDTTGTKRTFLKYGRELCGRSPFELDERHHNKRKWYIDSIPPLRDWTTHPYQLDTSNFKTMLQYILKTGCLLPVGDTLKDDDIKGICYKLLYYEPEQRIFTIQVKWEILALDKTYILIVNVQKQDGQYKICGLSRPYFGYAMHWSNNNSYIKAKKKTRRFVLY